MTYIYPLKCWWQGQSPPRCSPSRRSTFKFVS